jgi:adenylate cyclase, class 2
MKERRATNREIEVKLRLEQRRLSEIIGKIRGLGAICDGRVLEQNTLYDTREGDFRRAGRLIRIRVETAASSRLIRGGRAGAVLTAKAPAVARVGRANGRSRYKEKLERELPIRDLRGFVAALRRIGWRAGFRYEKYRTMFRIGGLHLCLDETSVGTFLELEGEPREIDRAARVLGFAASDYLRGTYGDLYAADCRRRGVVPRDMVFGSRKKIEDRAVFT